MLANGASPHVGLSTHRNVFPSRCSCTRFFFNPALAIPSELVSHYIEARSGSRPHFRAVTSDASQGAETQMPRAKRIPGSFGKLNTQKLKALAERALSEKKSLLDRSDKPNAGTKFREKNSRDKPDLGTLVKEKNTSSSKHRMNTMATSHIEAIRSEPKDLDYNNPRSVLRGWNGKDSDRYRTTRRSADYAEGKHKLSTDAEFFSRKSFSDIGCSEDMIECLRKQQFVHPSHIQAIAFPRVIKGQTCVIADQSGSGKTLAYLMPVIQRLKMDELQGFREGAENSPRALVIVPTAELAAQVLNVCRSISKCGMPFRSMVATGGHRQKTQLENLKQGVDVLIATPGRFLFLVNEGFLELSKLQCAVLDEVDILVNDEEFEAVLQKMISSSPVNTQYLFVTATLPVDAYNKLVEIFPDCEVIMGPGIHRTSSKLEEILVDCSGQQDEEKSPDTAFVNKKSALLQLAEQTPVPKTLVFCNKIETCRKVENALKRTDRKESRVKILPFHAALDAESRLANMKEFMSPGFHEGSLFLVCTDRASRGIDFTEVDHVVLFDFPRDPSEYVRRVGRTARGAGGKGKAFIFVVGKQVNLARRIIDRNQKGHPVHQVPNAYELAI